VTTPPPPPTPASTPTVVVLGAPVWNVEIPWMTLDASASTSPVGNTPLTYMWTADSEFVRFVDSPNSSRPRIQMRKVGTYNFTVTVTDSKGGSAQGRLQVVLNPPRPTNDPPYEP